MPSSQDVQSQPRRPPMMARQSSTSSQTSQSPSDTQPSSHRTTYKPQRHVVGHGRMGPRNTSFGKNLNKLNKLASAAQGGDGPARHHRRSQSGNSTEPSSPRPGVKRNASSTAIPRNSSHTVLKKNHSSGQLPRQASSKNMSKGGGPVKAALAHRPKSSRHSLDSTHPTVHFDVGDDDDAGDDAWTEESTSQSPNTTRSHTRQNSVVIEPEHAAAAAAAAAASASASASASAATTTTTTAAAAVAAAQLNNREQPFEQPKEMVRNETAADKAPSSSYGRGLSGTTHAPSNGTKSYQQHSRPPDADILTSKLLQRGTHNVPPQMSTVSATVVSDSQDPRSLIHSQGSTLAETPGRELVSRFMDGGAGSSDTGNFVRTGSPVRNLNDKDAIKRNKSLPNMDAQARASRRTGSSAGITTTATTTTAAASADLPENRTQQKLSLMRAASSIEPQKLIPAILPRTGGPQLFGPGVNFAATSEGRIDPRMQRQIEQAAIEYHVVRRYRNPLAEAVTRLEGRKRRTTPNRPLHSSKSDMPHHENGSLSAAIISKQTSFGQKENTDTSHEHVHSRTPSRYSQRSTRPDGDMEERQSFESEATRPGTVSAEEICRRLWEVMEMHDGEAE